LPPAAAGRSTSMRPVQGSTMCSMYTITGFPSTTPGGQNAFLILLFTWTLHHDAALTDCNGESG